MRRPGYGASPGSSALPGTGTARGAGPGAAAPVRDAPDTEPGPRLPRSAWVTLVAHAFSAVGTGMTMPFLILYLHSVRGIALGTAGAAAAMVGVGALAAGPVGGAAIDRFGTRRTLIAGWSVAAAGTGAVAVAGVPWQAFAAAAVAGVGGSVAAPAQDALLSRLVSRNGRSQVFAVRYAITNAGVAAGGLLAAVLVADGRPSSFLLLYVVDAATYVVAAVLVALVAVPAADARTRRRGVADRPAPEGYREGYREVVRDRLFRRLWLLTVLLVLGGYVPLTAVFPVYVVESAHVAPQVVSIALVANTLTVALAQMVTLRLVRGRRRTGVIVAVCGCWAAASCLVLAAGGLGAPLVTAAYVSAAVVIGIGETMLSPALLPLVNDLAAERLRGRYNAAVSLAFTTGFTGGPALAGLMLHHGLGPHLITGLVAVCGLAAILARRLARGVPAFADEVPRTPARARP